MTTEAAVRRDAALRRGMATRDSTGNLRLSSEPDLAMLPRNSRRFAMRSFIGSSANEGINPSSGEEVQQAVTKLYSASGDVVQRARQLIASPAEQK